MNMYVTHFHLMHDHKYSLTEVENMIPFEKDVYLHLLNEAIKEENRIIKEQQMKSRR